MENNLNRYLKCHEVTEKDYKCNICFEKFTSAWILRRHYRKQHCGQKVESSIGFGVFEKEAVKTKSKTSKLFKCPNCAYVSPRKLNTDRHFNSKHSSDVSGNLSKSGKYKAKRKLYDDIKDDDYMQKNLKKMMRYVKLTLMTLLL